MTGRAWRPVWSLVGLCLAYFAFPVGVGNPVLAALELLLTLVGLGVLAATTAREAHHLRRGEGTRSTVALLMLLSLSVVGFAFAFYALDLLDPGQVAGLDTRVDALYFTLSTMTTVGYGDVHAAGQVARAMVIALLVFDVAVLGALLRVMFQGPTAEQR